MTCTRELVGILADTRVHAVADVRVSQKFSSPYSYSLPLRTVLVASHLQPKPAEEVYSPLNDDAVKQSIHTCVPPWANMEDQRIRKKGYSMQ